MPSPKCLPSLEAISRIQRDKNGCVPKDQVRQAVGCYARMLRDTKNLEFGDSMREAWKAVNGVKCK